MVRNFPYQGKPFKLSAVEDASDKHREGVFPGKENRLRTRCVHVRIVGVRDGRKFLGRTTKTPLASEEGGSHLATNYWSYGRRDPRDQALESPGVSLPN